MCVVAEVCCHCCLFSSPTLVILGIKFILVLSTAIPYPGNAFDIEIYEITTTTASIRWSALPREIVSHIVGWRLMVVSKVIGMFE